MSRSAVTRPDATASTRFVVAFVLVGVGGVEPGDGLVEDIGAAEICGDGDPGPLSARGPGPVSTHTVPRRSACRAAPLSATSPADSQVAVPDNYPDQAQLLQPGRWSAARGRHCATVAPRRFRAQIAGNDRRYDVGDRPSASRYQPDARPVVLRGPRTHPPAEPVWAAVATVGCDRICRGSERLDGNRDRGHDRRPADDPDPGDRAGGCAGRRGQPAPVRLAGRSEERRRGGDQLADGLVRPLPDRGGPPTARWPPGSPPGSSTWWPPWPPGRWGRLPWPAPISPTPCPAWPSPSPWCRPWLSSG